MNFNFLKGETPQLALSKLCVYCTDNQVSILVMSWFFKSHLHWDMSVSQLSTLAHYFWDIYRNTKPSLFKAKMPILKCQALSQLRPQCSNMLSFQFNMKSACSRGMGPTRDWWVLTHSSLVCLFPGQKLLFNTNHNFRCLVMFLKFRWCISIF